MTFNKEELKEILEQHKLWLKNEGGKRANLSGANLSGADLSGVNLSGANLSGADLSVANLYGANLSRANLYGVNLSGANLSRSNLYGANLSGADLFGADLSGADLSGAENFKKSSGAFINCPKEGSFTAFKKCRNNTIVKLLITEDAKRSSASSRKCRASKAVVLEIQDFEGNKLEVEKAVSLHDSSFEYKIGEIVEVKDFDDNRWNECAPGIHFFITRQDAVNY